MTLPAHPPPTAGASLSHRRWRAHRLVLALSDTLAHDRRWASAACGVLVAGRVCAPAAVVAEGDPPHDGVLRRPPLLVVELDDLGLDVAAWRRAGVAAAWRLGHDRAEVADEDGVRSVAVPGQLQAPAAGVTLRWPLPVDRRRPRGTALR